MPQALNACAGPCNTKLSHFWRADSRPAHLKATRKRCIEIAGPMPMQLGCWFFGFYRFCHVSREQKPQAERSFTAATRRGAPPSKPPSARRSGAAMRALALGRLEVCGRAQHGQHARARQQRADQRHRQDDCLQQLHLQPPTRFPAQGQNISPACLVLLLDRPSLPLADHTCSCRQGGSDCCPKTYIPVFRVSC